MSDAREHTQGRCNSKVIVDAGDCEIVCVEEYPCKNKSEALAREEWWIKNNKCVNYMMNPDNQTKHTRIGVINGHALKRQKEYYRARYAWNKSFGWLNTIDMS